MIGVQEIPLSLRERWRCVAGCHFAGVPNWAEVLEFILARAMDFQPCFRLPHRKPPKGPPQENRFGRESRLTVCHDKGGSGGFGQNPAMGLIDHLGEQQQIVAAEALGLLPVVTVLVEPGDGHVVPGADGRLVLPDRGLDRPEADFMDGAGLGLRGHGVLLG